MGNLDKDKLIQEVREKGVELASINDLMKINKKYRDLVPILLNHLTTISDDADKEFLVRCLGVKGFVEASKTLIAEFYKSQNMMLKWAIGNSLSIISDERVLPEMITIAQEKEHGIARQMLVDGLGAFKNDEVKSVLIGLLADEDVAGHAVSALSKVGDRSCIQYVEPLLSHKTKWIKKEAQKAMARLEKI